MGCIREDVVVVEIWLYKINDARWHGDGLSPPISCDSIPFTAIP